MRVGGLELEGGIEEERRPVDIGELRIEGAIELLRPIGSTDCADTELFVASIGQTAVVQHVAYREVEAQVRAVGDAPGVAREEVYREAITQLLGGEYSCSQVRCARGRCG